MALSGCSRPCSPARTILTSLPSAQRQDPVRTTAVADWSKHDIFTRYPKRGY